MSEYIVKVKYKKFGNYDECITTMKDLKNGDLIIGESDLGLELGMVISDPIENYSKEKINKVIKPATKDELACLKEYSKEDLKILSIAQEEADRLKLQMDFFRVEHSLDNEKIRLSYTSTQPKVDFRQLLPILKSRLRKDLRLNQVNAREKAKNTGGIGPCGRILCCTSFLNKFEAISLNDAKNQQLPLNAQKLSGSCGKLMCCLLFENDTYTREAKDFPKLNSMIYYDDVQYKVIGFNIVSRTLKLSNKDGIITVKLEELGKMHNNEKNK